MEDRDRQNNDPQTPPPYPQYIPPGYNPLPPVMPQPPRRSRRLLWIALPLVVLLLIGGLVLLIGRAVTSIKTGVDETQAATTSYFVAITAHAWNAVHDVLDADLAAKAPPADLQATWQRREQADGAIDHFVFSGANVSNFKGHVSAQVTGTLVYQEGAFNPKIITLVQEGGKWKLSSLP